ncbi:MAG: SpoIVB peptidase S55 domain-containing protein [Acidobacteriota bacterium]
MLFLCAGLSLFSAGSAGGASTAAEAAAEISPAGAERTSIDVTTLDLSTLDWAEIGDLPTLDLKELAPGDRGVGLSVFAGTEPTPFDVEVIGVLRNSTLELSYLLARVSGQNLEHTGVAGGMSGSPVFFDGRLVGAVSFTFTFTTDPIAGITPIAAMRALGDLARPAPDAPGSIPGPSPLPTPGEPTAVRPAIAAEDGLLPTVEQLFDAEFVTSEAGRALLERHLSLLRPLGGGPGAGALAWSASGWPPTVTERLQETFGASLMTVPGGGAIGRSMASTPSGSADFGPGATSPGGGLVPGDAVAMVLMRGDQTLAAHGTITDRRGDAISAFGHPIYGLGPVRLPMARSEVLTVVQNLASSFKLSNAGPLVGTFTEDREAGAQGRLGAPPSMTPIHVRLEGLSERDYRLEVVDAPLLRSGLLAIGTLGAVTSASYSTGFQSVDLEATFHLDGHEAVTVEQSFDGIQAATDAAVQVLTVASFLDLNPLERVDIESIDVILRQSAQPRIATLTAALPDRRRLAPGDTLGVTLEMEPYRGDLERRRIEVDIPDSIPEGPYYLLIGDGASLAGARQLVEQRAAETFPQALEMLRDLGSNRSLAILGLVPADGLAVAGAPLPDLPASARAVFGATATSGGSPLVLRIADEASWPLERPLAGAERIDLEIRRSGDR